MERIVSWYINGLQGITETPTSQKIVDTTSRRCFSSWVNFKINFFWLSSNKLEIEDCIKFACVCGLLTCLGEGASSNNHIMRRLINFWDL